MERGCIYPDDHGTFRDRAADQSAINLKKTQTQSTEVFKKRSEYIEKAEGSKTAEYPLYLQIFCCSLA